MLSRNHLKAITTFIKKNNISIKVWLRPLTDSTLDITIILFGIMSKLYFKRKKGSIN